MIHLGDFVTVTVQISYLLLKQVSSRNLLYLLLKQVSSLDVWSTIFLVNCSADMKTTI